MQDFSNKCFALFFTTRGRSLRNWDKIGILEREIKLYQETARYFKTVYFFTYGGKSDKNYSRLLPANVTIVPKPAWLPTMLYSFLLPFVQWRKLRRVDIVRTNQMDGSWSAVITNKIFGCKLIVRCGYEWLQFIERSGRGVFKRAFAKWAESYAYRHADVIIHTSQEAADFSRERFKIPREKITIIPNYIDTELFRPLSIPKEKDRVIFVGRLEPQKNILSLVEALRGLSLRLIVIGNGSQLSQLKEVARKNSVSLQQFDRMPQSLLPEELGKSEIFVLPSLYEGNPKVLLEAMSCGLVCVASDVSGIREVIDDGGNGVLCDTDPVSIRSALLRVLANDELKKNLSEKAREKILQNYSFDTILKKELSVYNGLQ